MSRGGQTEVDSCREVHLPPPPLLRGVKKLNGPGDKGLCLSDEHDSDKSLPLNVLLCLLRVLCRGWWSLSKMVSNLPRVLLSDTVVRQSSSVPTTSPAFLTSLSSRPASLFFVLPPQHTTASKRTLATTDSI